MKVLVTGATGMVGSELTRQLLDEGAHVRILRRETSSFSLLGDVSDHVEHAIGDVRDFESVLRAMDGIGHVYHTAGFLGFGGKSDLPLLRAINVEGTANVADAALEAGVLRLVQTSSMAAFGRTDRPGEIIDEKTTWTASKQNSLYAESKYQAELEVHRAIAEGLDAVIVNPALIFGMGKPGENTREIVEKVKSGRFPGIPAGGTNVVDVRDVAVGHRLAMLEGRTGERYFLGSENLSWRTILQTIAAALGVDPPSREVPPGPAMAVAVLMETIAKITRTQPLITRETVRTANRTYLYSNARAIDELGCTFRKFSETATYLAAMLSQPDPRAR